MEQPSHLEPEYYEGLGRVVSLATQLLALAGSVVWTASGGSTSGNGWITASGGVGRVHAGMKTLIAGRPEDPEIALWWLHVQQVLFERHQLAHSILVRDDPSPMNGHRLGWSLVQTKDGYERNLPTAEDTELLLTQLTDLCATGYSIAQRLRREQEMASMEWDEMGLRLQNFVGFEPLLSLDLARVPDEPGVYCVLRPATSRPKFLEHSAAGTWKGRQASVAADVLRDAWIDGASVLYIGKASSSLRKRLRPYRRHGQGHEAAHWGGRYIWQLADHPELLICWRTETDAADVIETEMIEAFRGRFGARPFANLRK